MTVEKMEDIRRKTLEKEELDKAAHFKTMLYLALGMALILLLVWLLMGCSGKPSGNNQSTIKSDSALITQGAQTVSVHTQDTICHLPVACLLYTSLQLTCQIPCGSVDGWHELWVPDWQKSTIQIHLLLEKLSATRNQSIL